MTNKSNGLNPLLKKEKYNTTYPKYRCTTPKGVNMENPYLSKEYKEKLKALYPSKKKLDSFHIFFTKASHKSFGMYRYRGVYFREFTFILYFIEMSFHIFYKPIYKPDLQWSKKEIEILEKQGKSPLEINKILPMEKK